MYAVGVILDRLDHYCHFVSLCYTEDGARREVERIMSTYCTDGQWQDPLTLGMSTGFEVAMVGRNGNVCVGYYEVEPVDEPK